MYLVRGWRLEATVGCFGIRLPTAARLKPGFELGCFLSVHQIRPLSARRRKREIAHSDVAVEAHPSRKETSLLPHHESHAEALQASIQNHRTGTLEGSHRTGGLLIDTYCKMVLPCRICGTSFGRSHMQGLGDEKRSS